MTYTPTPWVNGTTPAINATNLNKMETGIKEAHDDLPKDLIAGVTPTLDEWTVDPTDAEKTTDGDISTFCTSGTKVAAGGYQYGIMEWDLGGLYHILLGGLMRASVTAGTVVVYTYFWDGSAWIQGCRMSSSATFYHTYPCEALCSKVRVVFGSTVAATVSPNVREINVWRIRA